MKHKQKYSNFCQAMINMIQASKSIGWSIIIDSRQIESAKPVLTKSEFEMFTVENIEGTKLAKIGLK